jgi:YVTN family beta-propeller protein
MTRSFFAAVVGFIAIVLGSAPSSAQNAYIPNASDNTVSVIATPTNTIVGLPIPVGAYPGGVAVTQDGSKVYIGNTGDNTVSVISTATNTVVDTIAVGASVVGVAVSPDGSRVYVTSLINSTVIPFCSLGPPCFQAVILVIDAATDAVVDTILLPVFDAPAFFLGSEVRGVAASPDGSEVYVSWESFTQYGFDRGGVLVICSETNTISSISISPDGGPGAIFPGVAVSPDGSNIYVAISGGTAFGFGAIVVVIDSTTETETARIVIGNNYPDSSIGGLAITPDGSKIYVTINSYNGSTVWVIDTATNMVIGSPVPVGSSPSGIAITPDGTKVYVVNGGDNTVSVIDTATNMVVAVLPVGNAPMAFGVFIQPRFAGTIGDANCHAKSISALAQTFGGLNAAAIALGFPTVQGLQTAVDAFCEG